MMCFFRFHLFFVKANLSIYITCHLASTLCRYVLTLELGDHGLRNYLPSEPFPCSKYIANHLLLTLRQNEAIGKWRIRFTGKTMLGSLYLFFILHFVQGLRGASLFVNWPLFASCIHQWNILADYISIVIYWCDSNILINMLCIG